MSCEHNTICYENALERFWGLMEDYEFQALIFEHFLSYTEQWKEKEFGFNEDPYGKAFDILWEWDSELLHHNIKECLERYIASKAN